MGYHLRIFALGVPAFAAILGAIYLAALLPLWVVEAPIFLATAYMLGKMIEIWARK